MIGTRKLIASVATLVTASSTSPNIETKVCLTAPPLSEPPILDLRDTQRMDQVPPIEGLTLRLNFVWALAGNISYALCQWGMIVALAKMSSSFMVGQFSLGLAISTPVLMFTNLQLRSVQATDVKRFYSFGSYLGLRTLTTM